MSVILLFLALIAIATVFSPQGSGTLKLTLENKRQQNLYLSYLTNNVVIKPQPNLLEANEIQCLTLSSTGMRPLSTAISFYHSASKLEKSAVVVVKDSQVLVTIDRHCRIDQNNPHEARVVFM